VTILCQPADITTRPNMVCCYI